MRERVFRYVHERLSEGHPPSVREVQEALGLSAIESARAHLERLVDDGRLGKEPGIARGYRLPDATSRGRSEAMSRGRSEAMSRGRSEAMSRGRSEAMSRGRSGAMSRGRSGSVALRVPILGRVAAGALSEAIEDADGHVTIEAEPHVVARGARDVRSLFALRVRGESMRDAAILHGDIVIVERVHEARADALGALDTLNGEIVVAQVDGEATVKTLRRRGATVELVPANPDFETIRIPAGPATGHDGTGLQILGRVIEVRRYLKPGRTARVQR